MNAPAHPVLDVADRDLCCGCGVCAAICPAGALEMRLAADGQWRPVVAGECRDCGLCAVVCPFHDEAPSVLDRFLESPEESDLGGGEGVRSWVGWATDASLRWRASSGGLATLALLHLLERGEIDCALVVTPTLRSKHPLFKAVLARDPQSILAGAGSKYYPVEFSSPLRQLATEGPGAAVVGLPCHCRAIRSALEAVPALRRSVRFLFGLTCGHLVTTVFTDVLVAASSRNLREGDRLDYRSKSPDRPSSNFAFVVMRGGEPAGREVPMTESVFGAMWWARAFVPRACDFCPDVFAECADATFMDAWLPEYSGEPAGTSLVVARTGAAVSLLEGLALEGKAELRPVAARDVVASQQGAVKFKRGWLLPRASFLAQRGVAVPGSLRDNLVEVPGRLSARFAHFERNRRLSRAVWRSPLPTALRLGLLRAVLGLGLTGPAKVTWRALREALKRRRRSRTFKNERLGDK